VLGHDRTGPGQALSAGADLHQLRALDNSVALERYIAGIGRAVDAIEQVAFVSMCVVEGYALAGRCELMLVCDLVGASQNVCIADGHLERGVLPGAGTSVRLTRAQPPGLVRRLLSTGEILDGDTAAAWGLVGCKEPAADIEEIVTDIVARLRRHLSAAQAMMKGLHTAADGIPLRGHRAAFDTELATLLHRLNNEPESREGLDVFAQRRSPQFRTTPSGNRTMAEEKTQ